MTRLLLAALLLLCGGLPAFAQTESPRLQIGGAFSSLDDDMGLGGFASYRLFPGVSADGAITIFTSAVPVATPIAAGRRTQILVGGKFGARTDGFGFFAKVRVGLDRQSRVTGSYPSARIGPADSLAVDLGGVVEGYIGPHVLLRFDVGDLYTAAGSLAREQHSLHLTAGAGWRF